MRFRSRSSKHRGRLIARFLIHGVVLTWITMTPAAQSTAQPISGTWTATAAPTRVFRGTWSGAPIAGAPDSASGSWTLVSGSNQIVAAGTWSATKTARVWRGAWRARTLAARGIPARAFAGTWATAINPSDARTLGELMQHTMQQEVSGAWQSAGLRGTWSLGALRR